MMDPNFFLASKNSRSSEPYKMEDVDFWPDWLAEMETGRKLLDEGAYQAAEMDHGTGDPFPCNRLSTIFHSLKKNIALRETVPVKPSELANWRRLMVSHGFRPSIRLGRNPHSCRIEGVSTYLNQVSGRLGVGIRRAAQSSWIKLQTLRRPKSRDRMRACCQVRKVW